MVLGEGGAIPATQPLGALGSAIEAFCEDFRLASDPAHVASQLVQLRSVMDRLEVVFSQTAATFAATDEYQNQGATSPIEWVRHNCRMTSTAAAEKVCVGEQMERMPQFVESLFAGRVGFGHLAHTARTARKLMNSATGAGFDETELLERAEGMSVGKFGYAVRHFGLWSAPPFLSSPAARRPSSRMLRIPRRYGRSNMTWAVQDVLSYLPAHQAILAQPDHDGRARHPPRDARFSNRRYIGLWWCRKEHPCRGSGDRIRTASVVIADDFILAFGGASALLAAVHRHQEGATV